MPHFYTNVYSSLYKPKPGRVAEIPKEDGRPGGWVAVETAN
jgi:hypothetical protein